jgi:hypothetical protein
MTEYSERGLTVRWDAPDLVLSERQPPGSLVIVAARPAHPSNVVTALYTVNGGVARIARGRRLAAAPRSNGEELFAIELPPRANSGRVAFVPILSCEGRQADPRRGGIPLTTLVQPATALGAAGITIPQSTPRPFGYTMELLARVTVQLEKPPQVVGETPDGLHIVFPMGKGGTVSGPRLNGEIEHAGGDWIFVRRDGIGLSEIRVLLRTPDGAVAIGEYGGVVDFGADGYAALAAGRGPERAAVQLTPRFLTAAPQLQWLNRLQCMGLGRVTLATLTVEYDLYAFGSKPGTKTDER